MSGFAGDPDAASPEARASEYVLGLVNAAEAATIRRDAMRDADLARAIARWETWLSPLARLVPPRAPPPALWTRIERSIAAGGPAAGDASVVPLRQPEPRRRGGWIWPTATVAALALAAAFAAVAYLPGTVPQEQVVALVPLNGPAPAFIARLRNTNELVLTAVAPAAVPNDRSLQLWLLAPGATTPTSLGLLPADGRTLPLPTAPPAGAQILVSLEPRGGSPTGLPTGPVLYGATLARG